MPQNIDDALADLARAFATVRARWYVFGAQAVAAAGVPRFTSDIDVTVEVPAAGPSALVRALEAHGFVLRDMGDMASFIAQTRVIPIDHTASLLPVDVVLAGPGLEEAIMERARTQRVGGANIPFIDTTDLIALKLLAGRAKDLEDVGGLLRASPPDLSIVVARQRVLALGEIVDDSTLVRTFDRLVSQETAGAKPRRPRGKPATPAKKLKKAKKATTQRRKTSPRRR